MKYFGFFISLLLVIYGLGNFYVLYRGYQWSPLHGPCLKWAFIIWGIVMMLSLPLMNMFSLPCPRLQAFWMTISYSWLVFVLYALMLVLIADLTGGLFRLFHFRDMISGTGRSILWFSVLALSLIHISEPTRLLSTSYAVFCLKKKNTYETETAI